jgi:hypothetical protein
MSPSDRLALAALAALLVAGLIVIALGVDPAPRVVTRTRIVTVVVTRPPAGCRISVAGR